MQSVAYIVYDFADQWPKYGTMLFLLLFVAAGVIIFFIYYKNKVSPKRIYGMIFGIFFAAFALIMSVIAIPSLIDDYLKTKKIYDNKQYKVVEGVVEHYHPMPESGHDSERFSVDSVKFEFSDFDESDYGYNNAASHGGAIKPGLRVKISYFNNGDKNLILKLETE